MTGNAHHGFGLLRFNRGRRRISDGPKKRVMAKRAFKSEFNFPKRNISQQFCTVSMVGEKMSLLRDSATPIEGIAARAWDPFGCRFGKSGEHRISMDRGAIFENFGARWAEFEDGDARDFRLRFPRLLTRSSLAARCTRSAREDLVGTDLRGSFVVSLHLVLKSGGKSLHFC